MTEVRKTAQVFTKQQTGKKNNRYLQVHENRKKNV